MTSTPWARRDRGHHVPHHRRSGVVVGVPASAEVLRPPEELARVDALLDESAFFAPFAQHFHPVIGRLSTSVECYLRLMSLKFRYRLGFENPRRSSVTCG